jgi:hypothetical protein
MYVCIFIKDAQVVVRRHRDNGNRDWSQIRDAAFFVEWKYPWVVEAWSIEEKCGTVVRKLHQHQPSH